MGEQYSCACVGGRAFEGGGGIASLRGVVVMGGEIVDTRQHERGAIMIEHDVLILRTVKPSLRVSRVQAASPG